MPLFKFGEAEYILGVVFVAGFTQELVEASNVKVVGESTHTASEPIIHINGVDRSRKNLRPAYLPDDGYACRSVWGDAINDRGLSSTGRNNLGIYTRY